MSNPNSEPIIKGGTGGGPLYGGGKASDMTLRDYFAAKAMEGFLSSNWAVNEELIAIMAYEQADEMLKVRNGT